MDNLKYLKAIKDNGLKEHLIKHPEGESSIGYRKTLALEIIAEELCIANKLKTTSENPVYVNEDVEANCISRQIEAGVEELKRVRKRGGEKI